MADRMNATDDGMLLIDWADAACKTASEQVGEYGLSRTVSPVTGTDDRNVLGVE